MTIRIGTAEGGSTFHTQGLALKTVLADVTGMPPVEIRVAPHASIGNAQDLDAGIIDMGFMAANWIGLAQRGEPPFARPIDLALVAPMNAGPLFFVARADGALRTVEDLRGRRVAVGRETSGMIQHARRILAALGLDFSDIVPAALDFAEGAAALVAGKIDAQLQCPIPNRVMTELSERMAVRVLDYAPGRLEQVLAAVPHYRATVMPQGAFRGLERDTVQVAVVNVLVTHRRVPADMVRPVAAAILAAAARLAELNPLFRGLDGLFLPLWAEGPASLAFGGLSLHDGAFAAYAAARQPGGL